MSFLFLSAFFIFICSCWWVFRFSVWVFLHPHTLSCFIFPHFFLFDFGCLFVSYLEILICFPFYSVTGCLTFEVIDSPNLEWGSRLRNQGGCEDMSCWWYWHVLSIVGDGWFLHDRLIVWEFIGIIVMLR